ncbi:MAG: hypothetical protein ABIO50_08170 [Nitrosospira sp.]
MYPRGKFMKHSHKIAAAAVALITSPAPVYANYYLNTVINNTGNAITVSSIVDAGKSITRAGLGRNGFKMAIGVPKSGVVVIYEDGTSCPGFPWAAKIEYAGLKWGFGYNGDGIINLTLNADNSLTVGGTGTPGGNGRVFPGGC